MIYILSLSKRDVVFIRNRRLTVYGVRHAAFRCISGFSGTTPGCTKKLNTVRTHPQFTALLVLLIRPLIELQTAFNKNRRPFMKILHTGFSLPGPNFYIDKNRSLNGFTVFVFIGFVNR
jgi:hypothetical protein